MRLKNIMFVLMVGLLVLLHQGSAEAEGGGSSFDTYNCSCKGDYMTFFSDNINSPYLWTSVAHSLNSSTNSYTSCSSHTFNRVTNNMLGEYFLKILVEQSDGTIDLNVGYIYLSSDGIYEFYNADGSIFTKYHNSYTGSKYGGISNGIYYGMWSYIHGSYPYVLNYDDGFNYVIECSSRNMNDKMHELAKYLCGETTELPLNVTVGVKQPAYDLESPLQIKVNSKDASMDMNVGDGDGNSYTVITPFKIWWHQSNIDLTDYKTEFYVREHGQYKKSLFSAWENISTGWVYSGEHITAKYCNNSLKWYEFNFRKDSNLYYSAKNNLGDDPFQVKFKTVDFMIRNKKEDAETGQMHYSNWVYLHVYEDGTYSVLELKEDYELDDTPEDSDNIDTDSPNYDEEVVYDDDTDYTPDVGGIGDAAKFIKVMKDLANSLGDFPDLFAQIFSFLPSWVLVCIGTLFVVIMLKGIF